jgi:hypothetical protein
MKCFLPSIIFRRKGIESGPLAHFQFVIRGRVGNGNVFEESHLLRHQHRRFSSSNFDSLFQVSYKADVSPGIQQISSFSEPCTELYAFLSKLDVKKLTMNNCLTILKKLNELKLTVKSNPQVLSFSSTAFRTVYAQNKKIDGIQLTVFLEALSEIGFTFNNLQEQEKKDFLALLANSQVDLLKNETVLVKLLVVLLRMKLPWDNLSPKTRDSFYFCLKKHQKQLSSQEILLLVNSLGKSKLHWRSFSSPPHLFLLPLLDDFKKEEIPKQMVTDILCFLLLYSYDINSYVLSIVRFENRLILLFG